MTPEDRKELAHAAELVIAAQFGSVAMLQRKMSIGFARASQLMTMLEEVAVVGRPRGSRTRDVLVLPNRVVETRRMILGEPS